MAGDECQGRLRRGLVREETRIRGREKRPRSWRRSWALRLAFSFQLEERALTRRGFLGPLASSDWLEAGRRIMSVSLGTRQTDIRREDDLNAKC